MYPDTVDTDPSSRLNSKDSPSSVVLFPALISWCESCWYFSLPHLLLDTERTKALWPSLSVKRG